MRSFYDALISKEKNIAIPEKYNYFEKLIGSWEIDYIDYNDNFTMKGEWHFSWALEGMAIQDVIILPGYEYGSSLRIYNPKTQAWDIAYGYKGNIIRLEARKENDIVTLTFIDNETRKWVFRKIENHKFHWQNITIKNNGEWYINAEILAKRKFDEVI